MSKTYFVVSDVHSFYKEFRKALRNAGFRIKNKEHILIVCGDLFDRGPGAVELYEFIKSLPVERRILIRGNHEYLLQKLVDIGKFKRYDISNGTADTVNQFVSKFIDHPSRNPIADFKMLGIVDWIFGKEWVDYYETDKYVFVHSWIPVDTHTIIPLLELEDYSNFSYLDSWRESGECGWEDAVWACPLLMYKYGLLPKNKTIVCGHYGAKIYRMYFNHKTEENASYRTYRADGLIAIDGTTVDSGICNVLVIDEKEA